MATMKLTIVVKQPYSFEQTLTFIRRFPPCHPQAVATDAAVHAAVAVGGRGWGFTLTGQRNVTLECAEDAPRSLARRAADFIGANDDVSGLYRAAEQDPPFRALVSSLHGLHQVRFLGLEDIAVYCVMMQRTPIKMAARMKAKFLERFGKRVEVGGHVLHAMPELEELAMLDGAEIGRAINHASKGERIANVVRGTLAIGEDFLRTAPYDQARDALLEIPGVGPFSAAAILLRGLGRTDELPALAMFEREGRSVYGKAWNADAIARRYGSLIGYWSFYLKTGAARL
jgi:DNA-3-methyladenine glycosylase II